MTNTELFRLFEGEIVLRYRPGKGLYETRRILKHFHTYLGEYPPTAEQAKAFLGQFASRKPATLARYVSVIREFMTWRGENLDVKVKIPKILPDYVKAGDIDKLVEAMRNKRSHKRSTSRDILLECAPP